MILSPEQKRLRWVLATLYAQTSVRRVVSDAGLDPGEIDLSGPACDVWHRVLEAAVARDRTLALAEVAAGEYPEQMDVRSLLREIRTRSSDLDETAFPFDPEVPPYRGLRHYELQHAGLFCGRDEVISDLIALLDQHGRVVIVGPSGVGKSSLARAGVVARLQRRASAEGRAFVLLAIRPGATPWKELARTLKEALPDQDAVRRAAWNHQVDAQLREARAGETPGALWNLLLALGGDGHLAVLLVDQLEELVTYDHTDEERDRFVAMLANTFVQDARADVRVIATVRSDLFPAVLASPGWRSAERDNRHRDYMLRAMSGRHIAEVIRRPSLRYGVEVEPELVDALVAEAGEEPGALPLLSVVLDALWQAREGHGGRLTLGAYTRMKGLRGCLDATANELWSTLDDESRDLMDRVFRKLVRPTGEGVFVRQRASMTDLREALASAPARERLDECLGRFREARLLVASGEQYDAQVEFAHEALMVAWSHIGALLDRSRDALILHERLREAVRHRREHPEHLWDDARGRLDDVLARAVRDEVGLTAEERLFIRDSQRAMWRRRAARAAVALVLVVFSGFSLAQWQRAARSRDAAARARVVADRTREQAEGLVEFMIFDLRDRLAPIGRLEVLTELTAKVAGYYRFVEGLGVDRTTTEEHRRAVAILRTGDVQVLLGRSPEALASFRSALAILLRIERRRSGNAASTQHIADCHDRIGDVLTVQGQYADALTEFRAGYAVRQRVARSDPARADWQRDLSVSHNKIGDALVASGRLSDALAEFQAGLAVVAELTRGDSVPIQWQRDLSISHNKIGDMLAAMGRREDAFTEFQAGIAIMERVASQDPGNARWQHDLSISHERIGDVLMAQGKLSEALAAFRARLSIMESLAQRDPLDTEWQRELAISHNKFGGVLMAQGRLSDSLAEVRSGVDIMDRLARQDPRNSRWQSDLASSLMRLCDTTWLLRGVNAEVRQCATHALSIFRRLSEEHGLTAAQERVWLPEATLLERQVAGDPEHMTASLRATVRSVTGAPVATVGQVCRVLFSNASPSLGQPNCRVRVVCGESVVYGAGSAGYLPCSVRQPPLRINGRDGQTTWQDQDPALEIRDGEILVSDDATGVRGSFRVELGLSSTR